MMDWQCFDFERYLCNIIQDDSPSYLSRQLKNELHQELKKVRKYEISIKVVIALLYHLLILSLLLGSVIPLLLTALCIVGITYYYCGEMLGSNLIRERVRFSLSTSSQQYLDTISYIYRKNINKPQVDLKIKALTKQPDYVLELLMRAYQDNPQNTVYLSNCIVQNNPTRHLENSHV